MATSAFRQFLPSCDSPRLSSLSRSTSRDWYQDKKDLPALKEFLSRLEAKNLPRLHKGFTTDGTVRLDLFDYASDEGAPTAAMVAAATAVLDFLTPEQKSATMRPSVKDHQIRLWSNPEFYVNPGGIRLDECSDEIREAIHELLRSSLSPAGYTKINGCCLVNGFLGSIVGGHRVMNEHSYNFRLFGMPDAVRPWGYTFFGHHLCLAVVVVGSRMVIGPSFMGAEPDIIDEGPHSGLQLFDTERTVALRLMQSLAPHLKEKATLCKSVLPTDLPENRWTAHDERHLGGARHDDRIVPYEGCPVKLFETDQKNEVVRLFQAFNEYYPEKVLQYRTETFRKHLDETYFAWIGGHGDDAVYYYRIHSPVAFMEFDFHSGVFLTNSTPARFHIHTINRIPNRADYGRALIEQYEKESGTQIQE